MKLTLFENRKHLYLYTKDESYYKKFTLEEAKLFRAKLDQAISCMVGDNNRKDWKI